MKKILVGLFLISLFSISAQDYKFGKVSKAELEEKFYPLDSTADAAYSYRYRRTYYEYFQNDGAFKIITEIHNRIKVYTKEGFEKATQGISFYNPDNGDGEKVSSLKGYTFNLNGSKVDKLKLSDKDIFEEKTNKYWSVKKITMPNIKEGCIIDIKYKIISPYYYKIDDLEFQFDIPVKNLEYTLEIPEYYTFNSASKGYFSIYPKKENKNSSFTINSKERSGGQRNPTTSFSQDKINFNTNVTRFKTNNIPALKDNEPFVSDIDNYRGGIKFELTQTNFVNIGGSVKSYSTSWETVSKQIYKSSNFGSELEKSNYYKDDLAAILAATNSDSEKTIAIFQFVKNKVKWNNYNGKYTEKGVKKAYKEGVGNVADINLMLTAMLRSAGLNANPVLVSTRANGIPFFPTLDGFNYVISMVEFTDGTYTLLDATEPFSLPNILPVRTLNWNGRKITKEGVSSWIKLTSSKHALEENNISIKISDEQIVEGMMRTKYDNLNALTFRKNNNHLKEENLVTSLEEKENIEIDKFIIINKEKLGKPIIRSIKFISEDLIEDINGKLYIEPLLFLTQRKNPFKLEERKFPVDFATPWKDRNSVSITIPEGYIIEKIPESMAIGLPENIGVFKYQVTQKRNTISVVSILQFNSAIISPQYYEALKDFYGQMVKKESEKIVLIKE